MKQLLIMKTAALAVALLVVGMCRAGGEDRPGRYRVKKPGTRKEIFRENNRKSISLYRPYASAKVKRRACGS